MASQNGSGLKVAIVAAEMAPFAKVGGLADVIGALPAALAGQGARACVVLPAYKSVIQKLKAEPIGGDMLVEIGGVPERFNVLSAVGASGIPLYLINHEGFFSSRNGLYGEGGRDYDDNIRRFIFFGRAAARFLADSVKPSVVHAHDWHACVLPIVMRADPVLRSFFEQTASLFTIHNMAFQGICEPGDFPLLNLDWSWFSIEYVEFYGRVNLMKGAIVLSDAASTVSPTYAREVTRDPEMGFGLEGVLRAKGERFVGILNGADYNEWNPATDEYIAARYDGAHREGKAESKRGLHAKAGLEEIKGTPLVGMVTRMTPQKGFDLLSRALDRVMHLDLQLLILGSGDPATEEYFREAERRYRGKLRIIIGFDNAMAHQIQAGSDLFLMPSKFEPCGLTQMYALKYGTVPVVRATGGLADTVHEFDPSTGVGNGFVFHDYNEDHLIGALNRAVQTFKQPEKWRKLMDNCFAADFSWDRSARQYMELYERLYSERTYPARP